MDVATSAFALDSSVSYFILFAAVWGIALTQSSYSSFKVSAL